MEVHNVLPAKLPFLMPSASSQTVFTYVVPVDMPSSLEQEDQVYLDDVKAVNKWWTESRWRYTKRPYTAEEVVAKRGNLKIEYPSNVMAKKLWEIVESRFKVSG